MKLDKLVVGNLATNCYIVSSQKGNAFVVDPGDEAGEIKKLLDKNKLKARFTVLTHGHIDHIKACTPLGLPVYMHKKDLAMVSNPANNHMTFFFGSFEPIAPQRFLKDKDELTLDELDFKVIHTPGHSPGSLCLSGCGILLSGDTLFKEGVGRTDIPGGSSKDLQDSLKKLSGLAGDTFVYPGHGQRTSIAEEFHG